MMISQLSLWSEPVPVTPVTTPDYPRPWPLGVWLRVHTTSLRDGGETTTIGRLVGYGEHEEEVTVKLINARGGAEAPISYVVGVVNPEGRPRTGFPKTCPTGRADPVLAINCQGCEHRLNERGHWRCDHVVYQSEPGAHFCLGCGLELGPYADSRDWAYCGKDKCLKGAIT